MLLLAGVICLYRVGSAMFTEQEWVIKEPREKVWKFLSRVDAWPKWMPGVANVSGADDDGVAITNAQYQGLTGGFPLRQELNVDQVVPKEKLVVTRRLPGLVTTSTYDLSDDPSGGTRIRRTVQTQGALKPLAEVLSLSEKSKIEVKLKYLLEQGNILGAV